MSKTGKERRLRAEALYKQRRGGTFSDRVTSQKKNRQRAVANGSLPQVMASYRRQDLIEEMPSENSALARTVGADREVQALPLGQLLDLYLGMREDTDRDYFVREAARTLARHKCDGERCLCGRVRSLRERLVDSLAIEAGVTPWLENPQHQVPGSAYSNQR